MNESTEGVTLMSGFIFDVIGDRTKDKFFEPLLKTVAHLDPGKPDEWVPITLYNDICSWIENKLGTASIVRAGRSIGDRAFEHMEASGDLPDNPTPSDILKQLRWAAAVMIKDPEGRGWEILGDEPGKIRMRRTQTFNCMLQEGLLVSLVRRSGVHVPTVDHVTCTRNGDDFCEYDVTWSA